MKYITRDGKAFELQEGDRDIMPLLVGCALAVGIGLGLRFLAESYPDFVVSVMSTFRDVALAIWHMLGDIADACFGIG